MAMVKYEEFYRRNGTWKLVHFINPVIRSIEDVELPIDSELHNFVISDTIQYIKKNEGIYKSMGKCIVDSVMEYDSNHVMGNFRLLPGQPNEYIRKFAKAEPKIRFLMYKVKYNATDRVVVVKNYGALTHRYKYLSQPLKDLMVYKNGLNAAISNVLLSNRNVFLYFHLPNDLMSRADLNKFARKLTNGNIKFFPDYKYFNILELWKYLNPEMRSESVFSRIPTDKCKNVNLMFIKDKKVAFVNLAKLNSVIKEYVDGAKEPVIDKLFPKDDNINPVNFNTAIKVIYLFIFKVMTSDATVESKDDSTFAINNQAKGLNGNLKNQEIKELKEVDINAQLEKEVKEKDIDEELFDKLEKEDEDLLEEGDLYDDDVSGLEYKETMNVSVDDSLNTFNDLMSEDLHYDIVAKRAETLKENKLITKAVSDSVKNTIEKQAKLPSPYGGKETLGEMLDESKDDINLDPKEYTITDNPAVLDKTQNSNRLEALNKKYIKNQYKKDMLRTIYSLQNNKTVIDNYDIEVKESILGKQEEHKIKIKTLGGNSSTISVILPKIEEDGTFTYNGNTYVKRASKIDLPIHKINPQRVCLTTYFNKCFINKSYYSYDNIGRWLLNQVVKLYEAGIVKDLVAMPVSNQDVNLPVVYGYFARFMKSFKVKSTTYHFEYSTRAKIFAKITEEDIAKVEKDKYTIIGNEKGYPIVIDKDNKFYKYMGNRYEAYPDLYTSLGLDLSGMPNELVTVSIFGVEVPAMIILSYYLGIEKVLKMLGVSYYKTEPGKRIEQSTDIMVVKFKDCKLVINKTKDYKDLITAGLTMSSISKITPLIPLKTLSNRTDFNVMFSRMELPIRHISEITMMETMFVDPISKSVLKQMKEPTSFKGLIIRSAELLADDNYKNPNGINGMLSRYYEDIPGLVYRELIDATRIYEGKTHFSKSKIVVNPYSVLNKITEDSTVMLEDDLNPMASIKQVEDITSTGILGRSKETMSAPTRKITSEEIGVISEATRDSGDVGISAYFSADPKISNIRGMFNNPEHEKLNPANVYSSAAMLAPFILTDDAKRANFNSIMQSHIIPIKEMRVPHVLTGYEAIIPIKAPDKFAITAIENGKVISVKEKELVVEYKDAGIKKYPLKEWTTKELSEVCYTHKLVTNLKQGDKFIKDDTLAYDEAFFEPSIFNPRRVVYKQGGMVTVALTEETMTDEDSAVISLPLSESFSTTVTKVKSKIINAKDNIVDLVKVGDKVEPSTVLFTIVDKNVNVAGLDAKARSILSNIKNVAPKAKIKGVISKIDIRYNAEFKDCSSSIKAIIEEADKTNKRDRGYTGQVDSTYSIKGKPLMDGDVEIKIYIKVHDKMGLGDKGILSNQLKFTVGEVMSYDMKTLDGKEIDLLFSYRAISARIVCSGLLIGTTSTLLEKVQDEAVKLYFN